MDLEPGQLLCLHSTSFCTVTSLSGSSKTQICWSDVITTFELLGLLYFMFKESRV